ncbi:MAG: DNA-processing protein DprA [Bacteroidia bacterium]|nr:DNA-processing protein DprA [Bacteroidia bacterium]
MDQEAIDFIALGLIKGVGPKNSRRLLEATNSVSDIFEMSERQLSSIDKLPSSVVKEIVTSRDALRVEAQREVEWIDNCGMHVVTYHSASYPSRLRSCEDAPLVIYTRGDADFNVSKVISVVGTRRPTPAARQWCADVLSTLSSSYPDLLVVSGLAYGVDIIAHIAALDCGLKTVGVVAHGMDILYPSQHRDIAKRMVINGGAILSEFRRGTQPEAVNFVSRNRIVAGMADATLVVESGEKGGSLITASKAHEYNRVVLAVPGSPYAPMSIGTNRLIQEHKAELVTSASDIEHILGWDSCTYAPAHQQGALFASPDTPLDPMQSAIATALANGPLSLDELSRAVALPVAAVSPTLLEMEFLGIIKSLPGNRYSLLKC